MKKIILASASPRRKKLLKKIVKNFKVSPSRIKESDISAATPEAFAVKAALAKAEDVALKHRNAIIIGADTIVVLGKKILGKPKSKKDAIAMLKSLIGRTHKVITGIAVVDSETFEKHADFEVTKVKMRKVSDKEILDYVKTGKPLDKAGSYGIQEIEEVFIEKIEGDYENVVGLPVAKVKQLLINFS
ncbi:MAG: Maf family protein [Candidatus Margulisiibacteriota bacterium]